MALLMALLAPLASPTARGDGPARPNILFIAVDDLNTRLGCYGASYVKTPNADRLAARGVRFDRAFCQYPVCNASRTSVLSGRYPDATKVFGNNQDPRQALPDAVLLPELFKQNGYFTAGIGKVAHGRFINAVTWDVADDPKGGDDEDEGAPATAGKAATKKAATKKAARKAAAKAAGADGLPFPWAATDNADDQEPDGQTARRVARLIEEHKAGPFFIAAGFHKPHVAHVAPKKYFALYPPAAMPLAPRGGDPVPPLAGTKVYPDLTGDQQRQIVSHYAAATTFMDAQLGVLLDVMDRLKLWDNTIVVFWGDHGWHHGEHGGLWAKFTLLDESARVPLIVAGPGIKPGVASGQAELIDLYPTLADLCGLSAPSGLQGRSFAAQLKDPSAPGKDVAYTVVSRGRGLARAVRTPRYTYIAYPDGSEQLFAASDAHETKNLVGSAEHASALAEMKERMKQTVQRASR
jgi:uncharacterized sulfatase